MADAPATRAGEDPDAFARARPYGWYRAFYVGCIVAMSAVTMRDAAGPRDHHAWLAGLEIAGAGLLLPRRTRIAGLVVLLAVFAVAALLTMHAGRSPLSLVLYAGTAVLVAQLGAARVGARDEGDPSPRTGRSSGDPRRDTVPDSIAPAGDR